MQTQLFKMRIKKNDQVMIMSGRDKGKKGKVLSVDPSRGTLLVEGFNKVKRHMKPTQQNPQGGIQEKEAPLNYSKVQIFCSKCNRGRRMGVRSEPSTAKKGKTATTGKVRYCKECDSALD